MAEQGKKADKEQRKNFEKTLKKGIYKALAADGVLSGGQLAVLLRKLS